MATPKTGTPYTAGDWWASADEGYAVIAGESVVAILHRPYPNFSEDETWANARLIAAAPDMLAALKGVVAVADRKTVEFDRARAAIAKAEGE